MVGKQSQKQTNKMQARKFGMKYDSDSVFKLSTKDSWNYKNELLGVGDQLHLAQLPPNPMTVV